MGRPFQSVPCGKGMLGMDAVGLEISGLEAGPKQVRVDVWLMGCQLLWAGMLQTEAGCDGALHILQESEDRTATVEFLPQNVS